MGKAPEELKKRNKEVAKSPISPVWVGKSFVLSAAFASASTRRSSSLSTSPACDSINKRFYLVVGGSS